MRRIQRRRLKVLKTKKGMVILMNIHLKQRIFMLFIILILAGNSMWFPSGIAYAQENSAKRQDSVKGASSNSIESFKDISKEGMLLAAGVEVRDGVYEIEAESSSSMFRIISAKLMVENGSMSAVITLGGKGYLKLFMGAGAEAVKAEEGEYIPYIEDADGRYTYKIPVEALDQELDCAAFSRKKEKWYDRKILFSAKSLPADAFLAKALPKQEKTGGREETESTKEPKETENIKLPETAVIEKQDGIYRVNVTLEGGSGRASVASPAQLIIKDKKAAAAIEWSSSDYDYMKIDGTIYAPVNQEGNSVFRIPVTVWDSKMTVLADTTAMSVPHEVEYTLTFDSSSVEKEGGPIPVCFIAVMILALTALGTVAFLHQGKKKQS